MATRAQIRAEAAERRCAALTAENAQLTQQAQLWATHAPRSTGFAYRLSDPNTLLLVQPDGYGHWALFLNSPQQGGAWNGTEFGPLDVDYTELYRWELFEALAIVDRMVADDTAERRQWRADREAAEQQAASVDVLTAVA